MKMRQIITTGLIIAEIMLLFSSSAQAQNRKFSVECNAALQAAKNQIQKNRKVKVVDAGRLDISQNYINYPASRPFSYGFYLAGPATESILNSDKLLTTIANDIINKCSSISIVDFGKHQTDWGVTYGLLSNNKIGSFQCINPNYSKKLNWGYVVCI